MPAHEELLESIHEAERHLSAAEVLHKQIDELSKAMGKQHRDAATYEQEGWDRFGSWIAEDESVYSASMMLSMIEHRDLRGKLTGKPEAQVKLRAVGHYASYIAGVSDELASSTRPEPFALLSYLSINEDGPPLIELTSGLCVPQNGFDITVASSFNPEKVVAEFGPTAISLLTSSSKYTRTASMRASSHIPFKEADTSILEDGKITIQEVARDRTTQAGKPTRLYVAYSGTAEQDIDLSLIDVSSPRLYIGRTALRTALDLIRELPSRHPDDTQAEVIAELESLTA